jgi:hypothetical protein
MLLTSLFKIACSLTLSYAYKLSLRPIHVYSRGNVYSYMFLIYLSSRRQIKMLQKFHSTEILRKLCCGILCAVNTG